MAADRPRQALAILNQQLSSAMDRGVVEAVSGMDTTGAGGHMDASLGQIKLLKCKGLFPQQRQMQCEIEIIFPLQ